MRYFFVSLLILMSCAVANAEHFRIELTDGSVLTAPILQEKPDRIIVDLGFKLLSIPRDSIFTINSINKEQQTDFAEGEIFRTGSESTTNSIEELARQNGGAVVLIQTAGGLGSGFIIHPDGYVVTNNHVIAGEYKIAVTAFESDGQGLERVQFDNVRLVATNPQTDLALLKIETEEDRTFPTVPIGDSSALESGQRVFAIGSPLGLDRSVSEGIISVPNRPIGGRLYIQTTTEISPGNSGGPLFNLRGEVVGVTNMKIVAMGAEGLAFAIPAGQLITFLENRDAYAFDPRNPNAGFRYNAPPKNDAQE